MLGAAPQGQGGNQGSEGPPSRSPGDSSPRGPSEDWLGALGTSLPSGLRSLAQPHRILARGVGPAELR